MKCIEIVKTSISQALGTFSVTILVTSCSISIGVLVDGEPGGG